MKKEKIQFYFPKWMFIQNFGDSAISTFIPKILKQKYKDCYLEVITDGFLLDIFKLDPNIDNIRKPNQDELNFDYRNYAINEIGHTKDIKVAFPEWHPKLFSFWRDNHEFLVNHPTANIITVNFLLQLKLEDLLFDTAYDFKPWCNFNPKPIIKDTFNVGIVVSTKLAGKGSPHPGCNGIGYRYKIESLKIFAKELRKSNKNIKIFEFSETNHGIGDVHLNYSSSIFDLINQIDTIDLGVMGDGGMHHMFNLRNKPIVLYQSNILSKVEFLKLNNAYYPEELHLGCRKNCRSYYSEVFGGEDLSNTCKMECEDLDPIKLAEYTTKIINLKS